MNQAGSFTKSSTAFSSTTLGPVVQLSNECQARFARHALPNQSSTFNGYDHFTNLSAPISDPSTVVLPPHMRSPSYAAAHASKPNIDGKVIDVTDLEEGVKLTILSDIERDQRLNAFKEAIEKLENKRKQDHSMFDRFIKKSKQDHSELEEKYGMKCLELLKLQKQYDQLNEKYVDAGIEINGFQYKENDLRTLLAMKNQEIEDLKETVALFKPSSPLDLNAMMAIMDPPPLDLEQNADNDAEFVDFTDSEAQHNYIQLAQRNYTKKQNKNVTDPNILHALRYLTDNVQTYSRNVFKGVDINGVRYAFYFGTVNKKNTFGMSTNIVLSSEKKVFNVSNIENAVEMSWNQDVTQRGKKRGYGHIYLGGLTGGRGFETNILNVFQTELGIIL